MGRRITERREHKTPFMVVRELFFEKKYNMVIQEATSHLGSKYNNDQDIQIKFMRAKAYRYLEMFDECINDLEDLIKKDKSNYALVELFFLYCYLNRYEEILKLIPTIYKEKVLSNYSVELIELVAKKRLNIAIKTSQVDKTEYLKSQIINYNPELALEHIKLHSINKSDYESIFSNKINLDYLYEVIRNNIDNSKKANINDILEVHIFSLANCGTYKGDVCNYIQVIVIPETNDVISIYPVDYVKNVKVETFDCNYDILYNREEVKQKTLSRIDRFNKKYGRV